MKIGVIGLGRMGNAIAYRAIQGGHEVVGFDQDLQARKDAQALGATIAPSLIDVIKECRVVWLMVPAGRIVDQVLKQLTPHIQSNDIIIDGGNSFYKDSQRRELDMAKLDAYYLDCGTSGGLEGRNIGFSLMVGGCVPAYEKIIPLLESLAAPNGYGYMGQSGSGHYVKMIHNGIEYALMQSLGDGFNLLKNGPVKDLDLERITRVWSNGSVIRSWLMDLSHNIFEKDQNLDTISGQVGGGETGRWTVQAAEEAKIPVPMIQEALKIRDESTRTGGNYATKVVALLRNQFGGHPIKRLN